MADKALTLSEFGRLEGGHFELMVNQAVRRLMQDCQQRPYLDKSRSLVLQLDFTPAAEEGTRGGMTVKVDAAVKEKIPPRLTKGEYLDMVEGVDSEGEPVVNAVFAVTPLFERTN